MHACLAPSLAAVIALGHSRDVPQWATEAHSQVVGHLLTLSSYYGGTRTLNVSVSLIVSTPSEPASLGLSLMRLLQIREARQLTILHSRFTLWHTHCTPVL